MSRTAAKITQADVARCMRAAAQAGRQWRVEVLRDGTIRCLQADGLVQADAIEPPLAKEIEPEEDWGL